MRLVFILLAIFQTQILLGAGWSLQDIEQSKDLVSEVIQRSCAKIEARYGLSCCGTGLAMCGGPIRNIGMSFTIKGPKTHSQLRRLIIGCREEVICVTKEIPSIQSFLHSPPFSINHVDIIVFVEGSTGQRVFYPQITAVDTVGETIRYLYKVPGSPCYDHGKTIRENYWEALETIRKEDEASKDQN